MITHTLYSKFTETEWFLSLINDSRSFSVGSQFNYSSFGWVGGFRNKAPFHHPSYLLSNEFWNFTNTHNYFILFSDGTIQFCIKLLTFPRLVFNIILEERKKLVGGTLMIALNGVRMIWASGLQEE